MPERLSRPVRWVSDHRGPLYGGVLLAVVVVGALVRLPALRAGLPYTSYVDEHFISEASAVQIVRGSWDPGWYWYPSLLITASTLAGLAVAARRGEELTDAATVSIFSPYSEVQENWQVVYGGRIVVLACAIGTIVFVALLARRLGGRTAGVVAAVVAAALPAFVTRSTILITDTPAAFFTAATLYFGARMTDADRRRRWAVLAGASAGLAFASKYTAAGVLLVPVLVVLARTGLAVPRRLQEAAIVVGSAVAAAVVAMPALAVRPGAVLDDLREQLDAYDRFAPTPSYLSQVVETAEVGDLVLLAAAVGLVLLLWARPTRTFAVAAAAFSVVTLVVLTRSHFQPVRNVVPLLPFVCVLVAIAVTGVARVLTRALPRTPPLLWQGLAVALVLAISVPFVGELRRYVDRQQDLVDSRVSARRWLQHRVEPSDDVLVAAELAFLPSELRKVDANVVVRPELGPFGPGEFDYVLYGDLDERPLAWADGLAGRGEVATFGRLMTSCARGRRGQPGGELCPFSPTPRAWHENDVRIRIFGPRAVPVAPS